jgi:FAD/FMN-containing dehydrogenase
VARDTVRRVTRTVPSPAVASFREGFGGEVVLPGDDGYDQARIVWNAAVDRYPAVVVRPTNVDDVAAAVRFGREQDLVIAVRCGGHSVGGFSTCDDGILIDLSRMRGVRVDPDAGTATVLGGSLLGDLDREAQRFGLACPVGTGFDRSVQLLREAVGLFQEIGDEDYC